MGKTTVPAPNGQDLLDLIARMNPKEVGKFYARALQAMQARIQEH